MHPGPIPAGTGETQGYEIQGVYSGAYPRRHGGNLPLSDYSLSKAGLSPQARGKLPQQPLDFGRTGPIPAGTGETPSQSTQSSQPRAYPRRHGGNGNCQLLAGAGSGLSPQARGKLPASIGQSWIMGPIPAGTGETCSRKERSPRCRAYPRRHGGNEPPICQTPFSRGLSPQARGKQPFVSDINVNVGPIPAGTGETCWARV